MMKSRIRQLLSVALLALCNSAYAQWSIIASGVNDSLTAAIYDHGRFTVAGDSGALLRSFDDGVSFSGTLGYTPGMGGGFDHLAFFDSLQGVATSAHSCCDLQRTSDGGGTWDPWQGTGMGTAWIEPLNDSDAVIYLGGPGLSFSTDGRLLQEEQFELYANIDSICNQIYSPGGCELIITSNDTIIGAGGWGWVRLSHDQGYIADTAIFNYGYYVYRSQTIAGDTVAYLDFNRNLRISDNKGSDWGTPQLIPGLLSPGYWDIGFDMLSAQHGVAVGYNGLAQVTDNGGESWLPALPLTSAALHDVQFIDALQVYAVGDNGTILHSMDGGYSWQLEESGTSADLVAIAASSTTVIIVGSNGVILRKDLSTSIPAPLLETLHLSVFPNPTSDQLTIIPPVGRSYAGARLELVDALGKTIRSKDIGAPSPYYMDLHELPNGPYLVRLCLPDGRNMQATIIKH